jgi:hypothetical protein
MSWWRRDEVMITHPSGLVACANGSSPTWRMRNACFHMLKGKVYARLYGPQPFIREYRIADGESSTRDLETGECIDKDKRNAARIVPSK